MHNDDLITLSRARIKHAEQCLKESDILIRAGEYRGAANRAYYAAFHAMRSVLILDEFDSKKHSGIIAKFREFYLKSGLFDKEFSDAVSSLFRVRTASDYDDFYVVSVDDAVYHYEKAENILNLIKKHLNTKWNEN